MADAKNTESAELPLSLQREDLKKLEISYGFYSSKMGAGVQEIHLFGDGRVRLKRTRSYEAEPEYREGSLEPQALLRLLELMDYQGLMGLEDEYPSEEDPTVRRILTLSSPRVSKRVIVNEPVVPEFERITGALLLTASLATPEALMNRFFKNL
ncbi:hypothetical protein F0U60_29450 [Archangium minus]|uniref:Uncharacterized protein n=1 Tax=Archangium minus TaxID=83450 RepID=A0ABY9WXE5_9BACT|nr:hypothetical protein F0U61_29545 [Archangium violaceum]WNG47797.1 hypothetical protein F0U60_29450 [Archangium minus]